jgi:hypothetical protein
VNTSSISKDFHSEKKLGYVIGYIDTELHQLHLLMLGQSHLLLILRPVNMHAPQLRFDRPDPLFLLMCDRVTKHQVHILEGLPTCLRNEEVREGECKETKSSEEDVCPPGNGGEHVRSHKADDEIRHPGAGGGDGDCLGSDREWVDL